MQRLHLSQRIWLLLAVLTATVVLASATALAGRPAPAAKAPTTASAPIAAPGAVQPQGQAQCRLMDPQPADPLELDLVASGPLFKTVAMEKEIFECQTPGAGGINQIRDVETFIEVVELRNGKLTGVSTEIATCTKNFPVGTIKCQQVPKPLLPATPNPLEGCAAASQKVPGDPVEMDTAVISNFVKTIKVEKEWFRCPDGVRDVYVFTEMVEQRQDTAAGSTFNTIKRATIGVVCMKDEATATIKGCSRFRTT